MATSIKTTLEHAGKEYVADLMRIDSTALGFEDHGITTFMLHCRRASMGIGVGTYALDTYDKTTKRRVGLATGMSLIMQILKTVGVSRWEQLPGQDILVLDGGAGYSPAGIADRYGERVLVFKDFFADHPSD